MPCTKLRVFTLFLFIFSLVFTHERKHIAAARPPPFGIASKLASTTWIVQKPRSQNKIIVRPPFMPIHFRMNRYKKIEIEAFRPTSPGRSPGAGHEEPPGSL
ncbi:hypothetical protein vseg_006050 [Gypsophila vaccaria]